MLAGIIGGALAGGAQSMAGIADQVLKDAAEAKKRSHEFTVSLFNHGLREQNVRLADELEDENRGQTHQNRLDEIEAQGRESRKTAAASKTDRPEKLIDLGQDIEGNKRYGVYVDGRLVEVPVGAGPAQISSAGGPGSEGFAERAAAAAAASNKVRQGREVPVVDMALLPDEVWKQKAAEAQARQARKKAEREAAIRSISENPGPGGA